MSFLIINNLSVNYVMRKETVYAAKNVNIKVNKGEIIGLVGESGSGKSTVGNAIIKLIDEPGKIFRYSLEPVESLAANLHLSMLSRKRILPHLRCWYLK